MQNQTNLLKLLGGGSFVSKTNAKNITDMDNSISMKIKQNNKGITGCTFVCLEDNTYSIIFYKRLRFGSTIISTAENIQANKLRETFTQHTEIIL